MMATYVIELASGMTYSVSSDRPPYPEVGGIIFRDYTGDVIALAPHGSTIIRQDAIAKPTADELQEAEQRGYDRARPLRPDRVYIGEEGTLDGATVTATDADLEPGDGPIPPAAPLSAYEGDSGDITIPSEPGS